MLRKFLYSSIAVSLVSLQACSGGSSDTPVNYTIGGSVTNLSSTGLVLQNNGGDDLSVAGTTFEFATALVDTTAYDVAVLTQPTSGDCEVSEGGGTINAANVTNVLVTCRNWSASALIETDTVNDAINPQIAIDAAGNATAVWPQGDGTRFNIWSNRYTAGSGWGTAELIETDNTGNADAPTITVNAAGVAIAIWRQFDGTRFNIWSNRYVVGSGWGTAELVENDNTGSALDPKIAMDTNGNALAVWPQGDGVEDNIWSNRYVVGTGWGTPEKIESTSINAKEAQISMDASGNALAVWVQPSTAQESAWSNRYVVGSGWGTAVLIETDSAGSTKNPQIAVDNNGNALAVWGQSDGTRDNVMANRYTVGSGWGTAELIETDNAGNATDPQIAVDAGGNALAVWGQFDGSADNIMSNRYTTGTGWGTAELIETEDYEAFLPKIAFDDSGNAIAIWLQEDANQQRSWVNRYTTTVGWGVAEVIDDGINIAYSHQIAILGNGNAVAVWVEYDGSAVQHIFANQFE
ncbi:MAG: hypothetical protein JKX75_06975 [Gammaproteobacteria bacterium]|nr:hypothetical protein [Gammaproteobacteria bacterium]